MKNIITILIKILFIITIFSQKSWSSNFDKNNPPSEIAKNFNKSHIIGQDRLTFFGFNIYDIALWSEDNVFSYDEKFAISIKYNKSFDEDDLVQRSIVEMRKNYNFSNAQENIFEKELLRVFNDIKKGDFKTVIFNPKSGTKFYHNSQFNGAIEDQDLSHKFVDIWLHKNSSYPKITQKLLGK